MHTDNFKSLLNKEGKLYVSFTYNCCNKYMSVPELIEDSVLKGYNSVDVICKNEYTYTLQKVYIIDLINNTNSPLSILGRHIKGINTVLCLMGLNYSFDLVKSITVSNRLKNDYSIKDNKLILKSSIVANLEDSSNSEEYSDAFSKLISSIGAYIYTNMLKGMGKKRKDYLSRKYSMFKKIC